MRIEKDFLGELEIDANVYYGIQTMRSLENFPISGRTIESYPYLIQSMVYIKKAAALSNHSVGALDINIKNAIVEAADEILAGNFKNQFPVDIYQGGGGLATNMNFNEVIANRANEIITGEKGYTIVHPNEHVNMSQSTNDVLPSAMKMACYLYLNDLIAILEQLEETLEWKVNEFRSIIKISRTCLQDALPMTFGQQFNAYLTFIRRQKRELLNLQQDCLSIVIGATAVGTSLGAAKGYIQAMYNYLPMVSGIPVTRIDDFFDGLQHADSYIKISGCLKSLCSGLSKMASDFRILASGPKAGLAEITLPSVQPGSSIMPGKINPCIPEMMMQICFDIYGMDQAITIAADRGELELNIWEAIIMKNIFDEFRLLMNGIPVFNDKCLKGIQVNEKTNLIHAESSYSVAVVISNLFGYKIANEVVNEAFRTDSTLKEIVVKRGLLNKELADEVLKPINLVNTYDS